MSTRTLNFRTPQGQVQYLHAYDDVLALWPVEHRSLFIETSFGSTHVITAGPEDGPPVVLLHGFGFSAGMWFPNVGALAANHRIYAVDVLGDTNQSVATRPFKERSEMAQWLRELLDALGIRKAIMIGHSYGGWLTLNFAMNAPHRVDRSVLLAPAASFVPMVKQFYVRLLLLGLFRSRWVANSFAQWCVAQGNVVEPRLVELFAMGMKHFRFGPIIPPDVYTEAELARVQTPTLLVVGEAEVIYDADRAVKRATAAIKDLQVRLIKHASHGLTLEQPDQVNRAILDFIQQ